MVMLTNCMSSSQRKLCSSPMHSSLPPILSPTLTHFLRPSFLVPCFLSPFIQAPSLPSHPFPYISCFLLTSFLSPSMPYLSIYINFLTDRPLFSFLLPPSLSFSPSLSLSLSHTHTYTI